MKYLQLATLFTLLFTAACGPQNASVPTLASLPSDTPTTQPPTSQQAARPTLPPTFTPTALPSEIPPTVTPTPAATLRAFAESPLGAPVAFPENYPVVINLRGGGYALTLDPPQAVRYGYTGGIYRLSAAYTGENGETFTLHLAIRDDVQAGEHPLRFCDGPGASLRPGNALCLSVTYTNNNLIATNPSSGGTLSIDTLVPLVASVDTNLNDLLMPNTTSTRFNPAQASTLSLAVAGQQLTTP